MHRIDTTGHVANQFNEGDPLVPRLPTQVDIHWLNAIQEELVGVVLDAGISLVKGMNTQLLSALQGLFVRVTGNVTQTITGLKTFTNSLVVTVTGIDTGVAAQSVNGNAVNATATGDGNGVTAMTFNAGNALVGNAAIGTGYAAALVGNATKASLHLAPLATAPTTAVMGDMYVAIGDGKLYLYNGSAWVVVGTQT